ncbi:helix-turn-helix domain-containing protein [Bifidobacterium biavatii]|uniref:XRE family transcriptional regulator n=1 Tax=Bifidobacterium biavatii DSM 23969 TaxID=1437608 RepID=A0A086ZLW5_9BIFI|nr:helix-turn-helix transcriptional regulator [Bifidobacterium biavatii]KFI47515.1 XRE family transcriptional regulator [Bifidobacterium biavatii DSM 23969]
MTAIDQLVEHYAHNDAVFSKEFRQEKERLDVAAALMQLRKETGLSQRELAERANKPQSTIARIESGRMNATISLLEQIAASVNKRVHISFVDA